MDVENHPETVETARVEPERIDYDDYASYEEGDSLVICERKNASAWVKSDASVEVRD